MRERFDSRVSYSPETLCSFPSTYANSHTDYRHSTVAPGTSTPTPASSYLNKTSTTISDRFECKRMQDRTVQSFLVLDFQTVCEDRGIFSRQHTFQQLWDMKSFFPPGASPTPELAAYPIPHTKAGSNSSMLASINTYTNLLLATQSNLNLPMEAEYEQTVTADPFVSGYHLMESMDILTPYRYFPSDGHATLPRSTLKYPFIHHKTLRQTLPLMTDSHRGSWAAC